MRTLHDEAASETGGDMPDAPPPSTLGHWPIQMHLVSPHAPFLTGADLVICADCVPFTVPDFHDRYLGGRAVAILANDPAVRAGAVDAPAAIKIRTDAHMIHTDELDDMIDMVDQFL